MEDKQTQYRLIHGYKGRYRVGDDGSVWTNKTGKVWCRLRKIMSQGYATVGIYKNGKPAMRKIHQLVLEAFVGFREEGQQCRHLNGVRNDNRLENLVWGTPKENTGDSIRHGTKNFPGKHEQHWNVKLTKEEVLEIRIRLDEGESLQSLAREYGVRKGTILFIKNRQTWKGVEPCKTPT